MSRIRRALFLVVPALSIGCSDDTEAPAGSSETGGAVIFGSNGGSGSGASGAGGTSSGNGGGSSDGGRSTTSGGSSSSGGATPSDGGRSSGNGGAVAPGAGGGAGSPGTGGANPTGTGGGAPTGLPIGSLCANDSNCSPNICCKMPACAGPCECQPTSNCPTSTQFLPCNNAADCSAYGGGKICCRASSGGQTMQYCTKTNGCSGTTLP